MLTRQTFFPVDSNNVPMISKYVRVLLRRTINKHRHQSDSSIVLKEIEITNGVLDTYTRTIWFWV